MARLLALLLLPLALAAPAQAQLGQLVVNLTDPDAGQTVSGAVNVRASVTIIGLLTVSRVDFYVDGSFIGSDGSAPYAVSWDSRGVGNGPRSLRAVAQDVLGVRWNSSTVGINVSNGPPPDTTPPTVSISAPASGATVSGNVAVSASATDNVGVTSVQFRLDGANLGAADTSAPYQLTWNSTLAGNGAHTLTAVARDAAGNARTSSPVTVTVSNGPPPDATPPTVGISAPAHGATVSGTITVSASAADNVGVAGVQFQLDGVNAGAPDTTAPYSIPWDTTGASDGTHTITAIAADAAGNQATSAPITITVANGTPGGTTRFEANHPSVVGAPAGAWATVGAEVAAFSGGTAGAASAAGASATFTFSGTAVSWLGLKCNACGSATVSIDGGPAQTVDTAGPAAPGSPGLAAQSVFSASGLAAGSHTLVITVVGNGYVVIDAFDVAGAPAGGGAAQRIEETGAGTNASGAWALRGAETAAFSGGQAGSAEAAGASFTLDFSGTAVSWIGVKCNACGIATVAIDGGEAHAVDTAGAAAPGSPGLASQPVFSASGLAAGSHRLVISVTGTTSTGGAHVIVDAFDVTP
jgi:hypothetical protein